MFNILLPWFQKWPYPGDRKNRKDADEFNRTINYLHVTRVSLSPQLGMTERTLSSCSHGTFAKIDHILHYNTNKKL